jgi:hypothetical protein
MDKNLENAKEVVGMWVSMYLPSQKKILHKAHKESME